MPKIPATEGGYADCPIGGALRPKTVGTRGDVAVGPVIFRAAGALEQQPPSLFEPIDPRSSGVREHPRLRPAAKRDDLFLVAKQLVIVAGSRNVVIAVVDDNSRPAALFYPPGASQATVSDGSQAVGFEGCDRRVGYPGGILSAGPQCLTVEVWVENGDPPQEARLPLGASCQG